MLLPDNIHPEQTVFFNGAIVLEILQEHIEMAFLDLYLQAKDALGMTMPVFVLCIDWLFLLDVVSLNEQGMVKLCS